MTEYVENVKEYVKNMKEYVKIRKNKLKIWRNMSKICRKYVCWKYAYVESMSKICVRRKYGGICGKYEEICRYIGFGTPTSIWALGLRKIPSTAFIQSLRLWKISLSFVFLRLQPVDEAPSVARCEVSLFRLLYISSKLFLLTYNSKPQKCECLGRWLPQTRAVSTQYLST